MMRFVVLTGYLELTMYLQLTGKLNQYINGHYTYLAYLSMILAFILACVQLIIWMKQMKGHSHLSKWGQIIAPLILVFPIFVGLLVPTATLDSTTVSAKGYTFPVASASSASGQSSDGTRVQYLKPDSSLYFTQKDYRRQMTHALKQYGGKNPVTITSQNYMEVMELIYLYPEHFENRDINYTGFVYNDSKNSDQLFLFRFGIIHCIADSGVYGLLMTGFDQHYANNTWLNVTGQIAMTYNQELHQTLPVLHISKSRQVDKPDNPYVYRTF